MARQADEADGAVFRSILETRTRETNPEHHWRDNPSVPRYTEAWSEYSTTDVLGPFRTLGAARSQLKRAIGGRSVTYTCETTAGPRARTMVVRSGVQRAVTVWEDVA